MFILYFALWVILNGKWTTEIGVFGLVFAAVIYAFTWKYMDFGPKLDFALMKRIPAAVRYGVLLVTEIVKANITVARMIFSEEEVKPQLVQFDVDLKKNRHLVALANSITLTPGTITVDLQDSHFMVHALDRSLVDGLDDGSFVQALSALEKGNQTLQSGSTEQVQPQSEETETVEQNTTEAEQNVTEAEEAERSVAEAEQSIEETAELEQNAAEDEAPEKEEDK